MTTPVLSRPVTSIEDLYSNTLLHPMDIRRFFKEELDSHNCYMTFVRLANLKPDLFTPLANSLACRFITYQDLQRIDIFSDVEINKLLQQIVSEQQLTTVVPGNRAARRYIMEHPTEGDPSTDHYLGIGFDLLITNQHERLSRVFRDVMAEGRYYEIYTHTQSYYAYPSEKYYQQEFEDKVLEELLQSMKLSAVDEIFPAKGAERYADIHDERIRDIYTQLHDKTLGMFSRFYHDETIHELSTQSRYKLSGLQFYLPVAQALYMWLWPVCTTNNIVTSLVKLMEQHQVEQVVIDDAVWQDTLRISQERSYQCGVTADIAIVLTYSTLRGRLGSTEDDLCIERYNRDVARWQELVKTISLLADRHLKVKNSSFITYKS